MDWPIPEPDEDEPCGVCLRVLPLVGGIDYRAGGGMVWMCPECAPLMEGLGAGNATP